MGGFRGRGVWVGGGPIQRFPAWRGGIPYISDYVKLAFVHIHAAAAFGLVVADVGAALDGGGGLVVGHTHIHASAQFTGSVVFDVAAVYKHRAAHHADAAAVAVEGLVACVEVGLADGATGHGDRALVFAGIGAVIQHIHAPAVGVGLVSVHLKGFARFADVHIESTDNGVVGEFAGNIHSAAKAGFAVVYCFVAVNQTTFGIDCESTCTISSRCVRIIVILKECMACGVFIFLNVDACASHFVARGALGNVVTNGTTRNIDLTAIYTRPLIVSWIGRWIGTITNKILRCVLVPIGCRVSDGNACAFRCLVALDCGSALYFYIEQYRCRIICWIPCSRSDSFESHIIRSIDADIDAASILGCRITIDIHTIFKNGVKSTTIIFILGSVVGPKINTTTVNSLIVVYLYIIRHFNFSIGGDGSAFCSLVVIKFRIFDNQLSMTGSRSSGSPIDDSTLTDKPTAIFFPILVLVVVKATTIYSEFTSEAAFRTDDSAKMVNSCTVVGMLTGKAMV